jgi:glycosyltransferase involved in cell wall biosynthesis
MTVRPRVVFGLPAYNRPDTLAQTLESLLGQTYRDLAVLIVDDAPTPAIRAIVDTYAALDSRLTYEANPVRLGMIDNWHRAFVRARQLYPDSEYFAWASDHDVWHPRWLEVLVHVLDDNPQVVLAYPSSVRIYAHERRLSAVFQTADSSSRARRLRAAAIRLTAGNAVYGLVRAAALAQAGVFRRVMMPDRQVLIQLALLGEFRQVPDILWYREASGAFSYRRQRQTFFPAGVPAYTYLPANVQHFGVLVWDLVVRGRGRPAVGRLPGLGYAALQLWYTARRELTRDDSRWREALRRTAIGRRLLPGGRAVRDARRQAAL